MIGGSAEFRASDNVGIAVNGGLASEFGVGIYDIGAEARLYGVGDFSRGLFLAADLGTTDADPIQIGESMARVGGWAGGKLAFRGGLTIEGALGVQAYLNDTHGVIGPAANVGLGFSF
jgi:hypothetical protein